VGFVDDGAGVYGGWRESVPNRSGSAPPSMEGSLSALGHLIGQHSGSFEASSVNLDNVTDNSKSEDQLQADPAYFEYYGSKVKLNPRLPPPLILRESCHLMNQVGRTKEWRVVSQDNSVGTLKTRFPAYKFQVKTKGEACKSHAPTCPAAPAPAVQSGAASGPPRVLRLQLLLPSPGQLRGRHVSCGSSSRCPVRGSSGAATCPLKAQRFTCY
jgi:hypothetical protein